MDGNKITLGTVLKVQNKLGMVVGIHYVERQDHIMPCYAVVPWPSGYVADEQMLYVPLQEAEVISEGYHSPYSEAVSKYMEQASDCFSHLTLEEGRQSLAELSDWISKEAGKNHE